MISTRSLLTFASFFFFFRFFFSYVAFSLFISCA